jgi:hypothetical protein
MQSKPRPAFGFVEIILTMAIMSFLAYLAYKNYFLKPLGSNPQAQQMMKQENIDGSNYLSLKKSLESKVTKISQQAKERRDQTDDQLQ